MEVIFPIIIIFSFIFSTIALLFMVIKIKYLVGIYHPKKVMGFITTLVLVFILSLFFLNKISTM